MTQATTSAALFCRRLTAAEWGIATHAGSTSAPPPFGGLAYALHAADGAALWRSAKLGNLALPLLSPAAPLIDAWSADAPVQLGQTGAVQWSRSGTWLHGTLQLEDQGLGLEETTRLAYLDVFASLRQSQTPHLMRIWNYLPHINAQTAGLERYRQFNVGRQRAFVETGHDAFEGAPAACALGTQGTALQIHFLAGCSPARPVENLRQVPAYRYPGQFGPRAPSFSRAALADAGQGRVALWVSGTASIVGFESVHVGDTAAQLAETVRNLRAVLAAAGQQCTAQFELSEMASTLYLRHADQAAQVARLWQAEVGPTAPASTRAVMLQADICRSDLLLEIEGHLIAPGVLK